MSKSEGVKGLYNFVIESLATSPSFIPCEDFFLLKFAVLLNTAVQTRIQISTSNIYYIVKTYNTYSIFTLIKYLDRFPLLSSKKNKYMV
jgi:hypothetical protein